MKAIFKRKIERFQFIFARLSKVLQTINYPKKAIKKEDKSEVLMKTINFFEKTVLIQDLGVSLTYNETHSKS